MNNKQREILHQHRHFLAKNIIWSDSLANKLLSNGVITDSELKQIQNGKDPKSHDNYGKRFMAKLLEALPLRGSGVYDKFCNVLLLNGHSFIADFLKDEERGTGESVDLSLLFKDLPVLEKVLKPEDKTAMETFINEKIKDSNLKGVWTKEAIAREKDKAIEAKQRQLEDAFEYEAKDKQYKAEIAALEKKIAETKNETIELKSQLGFMGSKLRETEDKFKTEFGVQMQYNNANENAMKKLEAKIEQGEKALRYIEKGLSEVLPIPGRNSERDQMAKAVFKFAFVGEDFDRFVDKYKLLKEVEKQYDQLLQEQNYILSHLGHHSTGEKPSLLNAYRDFAVKTDEDMLTMKQQIQKDNNIIEGQQEKIQHLNKEVETVTEQKKLKNAGTVWQNAMMSVMRKQLNDVKYDNRLKDTRIKNYETEANKLKSRVLELEVNMAEEKRLSHRSQPHPSQKGSVSPERHFNRMDDDDESVVSRAEAKSRRNTLLPPLGGRVLFQSTDATTPRPSPSPTRMKPKPTTQRQSMWQQNVAVPEGLMTHQLRLEHRASEDMPVTHRTSQGSVLSHGLGGLKVMQGKPSKYAHVRS